MTNKSYPRIFLSPPHLSGEELAEITEAIESNYIAPAGPKVRTFEEKISQLLDGINTLAVNSGTSAIHLAMKALNISPGDRLLASTLTFIGGVAPACWLGAEISFIDSDSTWTMNPQLLDEELKESAQRDCLPKAVLTTDLYGQCSDYDALQGICQRYEIPLLIDAAEALGSSYKGRPAGVAGAAGILSFNGNKIVTTSAGGMVLSSNNQLIEKARYFSQQAREPVSHYLHAQVGYNYGMSNILAAIGLGQLKSLSERVSRKREIFQYYKNALDGIPGIDFMPEAEYGHTNRWLSVILIDKTLFGADKETLRLALEAKNIEARAVMMPMHLQPVFNQCRVRGGAVSEYFFKSGLCLPSGIGLTMDDLHRIVDVIKNIHETAAIKRKLTQKPKTNAAQFEMVKLSSYKIGLREQNPEGRHKSPGIKPSQEA